MVQEVSGVGRVASQPGQIGLRPEPASSLGHSATVPSRKPLYPDYRPSGIRKHWDHCSMVANSTGDLLRKRGIPESYGDPIEAVAWFDNKIGALCVAVADYPNGKRITYRVRARDWQLDIETIRS